MPRGRLGHYEERRWKAQLSGPGGRRHRSPFTYRVFIPKPIADRDFDLRGSVANALTDATTALGDLNGSPPKLASLEALGRQLLRSESLASSRIEGLQLSHRRLARAAYAGSDSDDPGASDVAGNVAAMERAIELGSMARPLAIADIDDIHRELLRFTVDRGIAGILRKEQGWIGGTGATPRNADYIPPPPKYVRPLLEDLCAFIARDDLPALAQAAIAHAQFETIHPFADGNGRVGRALIHVVLRRRGAAPRYIPPISLILGARRRDYIAGLVGYREGHTDDWFELFALTAAEACREAERFADEIDALQAEWLARLGNPRSDAAVRQVVSALPAHPVIDVRTAETLTGKSNVAAGKALKRLEEADIIQLIGGRKWGRTWECRPLFELANRFENELTA